MQKKKKNNNNVKIRPVIDLSLLNQYIRKQPFKTETVKSVRQSIFISYWTVSIDLTNANLHVQIHLRSRKYLWFMFEGQVIQFTVLSFEMSLSPWIYQTDGRYSIALASKCHFSISVPRRLAYKRSNSDPASTSHNILPPNCTKSRFHSKSKEVRFDTSPETTFIEMEFLTQQNTIRVPQDRVDNHLLTINLFLS